VNTYSAYDFNDMYSTLHIIIADLRKVDVARVQVGTLAWTGSFSDAPYLTIIPSLADF
jgi:hypothetical protein